ncbi:MAG: hypothetical protein COB99_00855 [Sulfurimonas sp.]|nr:MAG: hypothetical protein COB99_00855 [Sulfurimonas sp.]
MKKLILILAIFSTFVFAQSSVEVLGTSTLHDWKMASESLEVSMAQENGKFTKLDVSMIIETLKSGDSGLDDNAYEAMKIDKYSTISFSLLEQKDDGSIVALFKVLDKEQKKVLKPDLIEDGHIAGSFKVKMTTFGIEPPSFLFGAMSAGNEITIKYDIRKP